MVVVWYLDGSILYTVVDSAVTVIVVAMIVIVGSHLVQNYVVIVIVISIRCRIMRSHS